MKPDFFYIWVLFHLCHPHHLDKIISALQQMILYEVHIEEEKTCISVELHAYEMAACY